MIKGTPCGHAATSQVAPNDRGLRSEEKAQMSGLNPTGKKRNSEETGGNNRKEREIPGRFRKAAERTGKNGKIFGSGPKGRGFESRHFDAKIRSALYGCFGFLISEMMDEEPAAAAANDTTVSPVGFSPQAKGS